MRTRRLLPILLTIAMVLILLPAQPTHAAIGSKGPILLDGLKVKVRAVTFTPTVTVTNNEVIYTIDGTDGKVSGLDTDIGHALWLSFKTKRQGGSSDLIPITYEPVLTNPGTAQPDNGDWSPTGSNPDGYLLKGSITYTCDLTSDPTYYLYRFRFYHGSLSSYDASDYTDYVLRIRRLPKKDTGVFFEMLYAGYDNMSSFKRLYGPDFAPMAESADYREYIIDSSAKMPTQIRILTIHHTLITLKIDGVSIIGKSDKLYTLTEDKPYVELVLTPKASADTETIHYLPTKWRIGVRPIASPKQTPTKAQFTYSLASKTYNGQAQGVIVTPKTGVGSVTAVYYNKSTTKPKKAGSYAVTVDVAAGTKYTAAKGISLGTFTINKASIAKLTATVADAAWTGKQIKPTKFTLNGKSAAISAYATVKSYGANKNIGKGTIKIAGKGNYTGTKTLTFRIIPKKGTISKIAVGAKQMKVTWKKAAAAQKLSKYELRYRVKGSATWKTKTLAASAASATIKGLAKGRVYEVELRCLKTVSGKKYYSEWSKTKTSGKIK